jgi:RNA polymerase sigma-70 factor (ECF subfamily)
MVDNIQRAYDALLIIRFNAGDDGALEELIVRHRQSVRAAVKRRLGGEIAAVDDIVQEVWLQVIQKITQLRDPVAWQAWLGRIVATQVALFIRRKDRVRVPFEAVAEVAVDLPSVEFDPDAIAHAVSSLSEPYRSVVRLRFWESLKYEEIAQRLSILPGTVRSRLHEARRQLGEILHDHGEQ